MVMLNGDNIIMVMLGHRAMVCIDLICTVAAVTHYHNSVFLV